MKHQNIYNRLKRVEGQIRGIEEMLQKGRSDQDILIQLQAAKSATSSVLAAFIEPMIRADSKDGKITINEDQLRSILRIIK